MKDFKLLQKYQIKKGLLKTLIELNIFKIDCLYFK